MLTITSIEKGKCAFCQEDTEVVHAEFKDGLKGKFCRRHVWEALKARGMNGKQSPEQQKAQ